MTLYRKWNNTTWAGGGWAFADGTYAGATNPGAGDTLKVDSLAGNPGTLSNGATTNRAALYVASDSASNSWYMTPTSAGNQIQFSTGSIDGAVPTTGGRQYALYLEDNKSFGYQGNIGFFTSRNIYVGSGATFYNGFATASTQACIGSNNAGVSINKYGLGAVKFGTAGGSFVTPYQALSAVNVREGTAIVNGGTTPSPMGNGTFALGYVGNTTTPMLQFVIEHTAARTLSNSISVESNSIIDIQSGFVPTITGTISGAGTLLIQGGSPLYVSNTVSCPLNMSGSLTMNSTNSITSSSIIGAGTINMNGGTISGTNASLFTGAITGTFTANSSDIAANITGTVNITAGDTYFRGSSSGAIGSIGYANGYVYAPFTTNSGTTSLTGGGTEGAPIGGVSIYGPSGSLASGRTVQMSNRSWLRLLAGGSISSPISVANDATIIRLQAADASICTFNSTVNASTKTSGSVRVQSAAGGIAVFAGSLTTGGAAFDINADAGFTGTVRLTGSGFSGGAATLSQGTLHINGASTTNLGTGLTVSNNTTLACSSTAAYAAQLSGPVTLASGSTFRFGAPA